MKHSGTCLQLSGSCSALLILGFEEYRISCSAVFCYTNCLFHLVLIHKAFYFPAVYFVISHSLGVFIHLACRIHKYHKGRKSKVKKKKSPFISSEPNITAQTVLLGYYILLRQAILNLFRKYPPKPFQCSEILWLCASSVNYGGYKTLG